MEKKVKKVSGGEVDEMKLKVEEASSSPSSSAEANDLNVEKEKGGWNKKGE